MEEGRPCAGNQGNSVIPTEASERERSGGTAVLAALNALRI